MRMFIRPTLVLVSILAFVAGCGQTGDLILPDRGDQTQVEEEEEKETD